MGSQDATPPRADAWLGGTASSPRLVVAGVPTSVASLTPSSAHRTPQALRGSLSRFATFDGEDRIDLRSLPVADVGDWDVADLGVAESQARVAEIAATLPRGPAHAFLGGDNSITRPLVNGLARSWGTPLQRVGVLTFDAHHDVRDLDAGPNNGTPIRGLIADGLPGSNVVQVGIHSFANTAADRDFCEKNGVRVVTMERVNREGIEAVTGWALDAASTGKEWVYVDFDLDVLDHAFAPACPGSRPGGLLPRQLAKAAHLCGAHPLVMAADFVEVDAAADRDDVTVMNLATVLLKFATGVSRRHRG